MTTLSDGDRAAAGGGQRELGDVRSELRRLGYLDDTVERFLLQDAIRPERPAQALRHLSAKVGLLIGLPLALVATLALAIANGHLAQSPFDLPILFLHLALPATVMLGLVFALSGGLLALLLHWTHARRIETWTFALGVVAGAVAAAGAARLLSGLELPNGVQLAAAVIVLPALAYGVFKVVHGGLLTLAIRLTHLPPERPRRHGAWLLGALALGSALLVVPTVLNARAVEVEGPSTIPLTGRERVALVAVDGVVPAELDLALGLGWMPTLQRMVDEGAWVELQHPTMSPAALWTSVSTGLEPSGHGLSSLDAFLPLGMQRPLTVTGWLRPWWSALAATPVVGHQPVLAGSRRAWAIWELAGRGSEEALVINWWSTFPVWRPQAGLVLAHGGHQLLADGTDGAVVPESQVPSLRALAGATRPPDALLRGLDDALGAARAERVVTAALAPDLFYQRVFVDGLENSPRVAALYLPGLDIATGLEPLPAGISGLLVRQTLESVDRLLAEPELQAFDTILLAIDRGRRSGDSTVAGRVLLWRRDGACQVGAEAAGEPLTPAQLGAAAARAVGLPQSAELPAPPTCRWPGAGLSLDTFGSRPVEDTSRDRSSEEYLEQLQSLGYL